MGTNAEAQTVIPKHNSLRAYIQHLAFYVKKRGVHGSLRRALKRFWIRQVGQREWLYLADLTDFAPPEQNDPVLELVPYYSEKEATAALLSSLGRYKSPRTTSFFLSKWFSRGATLWASSIGGDLVGVQWTLGRGINGFYSVPIHPREVIIVAVEVFLPFKGKGFYPRMLAQLLSRLKESGNRRAYIKVANSNIPMRRSMSKTLCLRIGRVYTFRIFGRWLTIWDET